MALVLVAQGASAQLSYSRGQKVTPAYEGWEREADGTRYFLFGYMNRNWLEELDVEVGTENSISPGPADQGPRDPELQRRARRPRSSWGTRRQCTSQRVLDGALRSVVAARVLAPLAVGGVNVSPCKKGLYATFGTQQRSQALFGL